MGDKEQALAAAGVFFTGHGCAEIALTLLV
jgi:hypothetical protein